jgi:hypothetical protein
MDVERDKIPLLLRLQGKVIWNNARGVVPLEQCLWSGLARTMLVDWSSPHVITLLLLRCDQGTMLFCLPVTINGMHLQLERGPA